MVPERHQVATHHVVCFRHVSFADKGSGRRLTGDLAGSGITVALDRHSHSRCRMVLASGAVVAAWATAHRKRVLACPTRALQVLRIAQWATAEVVDTVASVGTEALQSEADVRSDVRNIAIIAHVDHGKTTLVDALMKQTSEINDSSDHHMDSNQIEQERGITILAKNAAITYDGVKVNLIDTPGHADFGGEVERILNMADGCMLLVDAQEGPKPQTKFVLQKALELKRRVIVCINKVDKPAARPDLVLDKTFDLFAALGADDDLCDFPVCYASGIRGMASIEDPDSLEPTLEPLIKQIIAECPKPRIGKTQPLQMLVSNVDYDDYLGRICIGRIRSASLRVGQNIGVQRGEDGVLRVAKVAQLWEFANNNRISVEEIRAGDICAFAGKGIEDVMIGDTIVDPEAPLPLPPLLVEEPTVMMTLSINTSPLAGKSGGSKKTTSNSLKSRLERETLTNIALRVEPGSSADSFTVKGRGMLQLGILVENMRREGYELMVSAPEVIEHCDQDTGERLEPYAEAVVEVPEEFQGFIMEEMQKKGATQMGMETGTMEGEVILTFEISVGGLIGMHSRFLARTSGAAVLHSQFLRWGTLRSENTKLRERGSIYSTGSGVVTSHSLCNARQRGTFFVQPADQVYRGMCVGIHNKERDLALNVSKSRDKNNVRDEQQKREMPPALLKMTIDDFLGHMDTDELLEVTPDALRLCKKPEAIPKNDG